MVSEGPFSPNLQQTLNLILDQLATVVVHESSAILLLNDDHVAVVAARGYPALAHLQSYPLADSPVLHQLLAEVQPVAFITHGDDDPFYRIACYGPLCCCINVPLRAQDKPIGILTVSRHQPSGYTPSESQLLAAFARQSALTIENVRLYEEARRRALQLEAAAQVGRQLTLLQDLDQLLAETVKVIRENFGYYQAHILLVDAATNELVLKEANGPGSDLIKGRGLRLKVGEEGITGWVAQSGEPLLCNDVRQEPRFFAEELLPETKAELAVPLRLRGRAIGVLDVQSDRLSAFDHEDIIALQLLGDQVAIAIENARLFEETKNKLEAMRALHDVSFEIVAQQELSALLATLMQRAAHLVQAEGAALYIYEAETSLIRNIANFQTGHVRPGYTMQPGEGLMGQVIQNGEALIVHDYQHWPRASARFRPSEQTVLMGVPLKWRDQIIGGLLVLNRPAGHLFTPEDQWVLQLFADLAAIAIENARLFEQTKSRLAAMHALHDISLDILAQLDLSSLLDTLLQRAALLVQAERAVIYVYDEQTGLVRNIATRQTGGEEAEITLRPGEGLVGIVVQTGQALIVNDYPSWRHALERFRHSPLSARMAVPLRRGDTVIGALMVASRPQVHTFGPEDQELLDSFADLAVLALKNAELYNQIKTFSQTLEEQVAARTSELDEARQQVVEQAEQVQWLLSKTVHIQEEEHARIARDLHDSVTQLTIGAMLELQAAKADMDSRAPDVAREKVDTARDLLKQIEREIRQAIYDLRPALLDASGLLPALQKYATSFQQLTGITCHVQARGTPTRLPPPVEVVIFRIVQEALQNVMTHAHAQTVTVSLAFEATQLCVMVKDDGRGFDPDQVFGQESSQHFGLSSMRERAMVIGGQAEIWSKPGQGTRVTLRVALQL